jgi:hypothetical protein
MLRQVNTLLMELSSKIFEGKLSEPRYKKEHEILVNYWYSMNNTVFWDVMLCFGGTYFPHLQIQAIDQQETGRKQSECWENLKSNDGLLVSQGQNIKLIYLFAPYHFMLHILTDISVQNCNLLLTGRYIIIPLYFVKCTPRRSMLQIKPPQLN